MGGLFSGKSKTTSSQTVNTGPLQFQQPYLTDAFSSAQGNYDAQKGTPYYGGETYAGMSDDAKSALDAMKSYASGAGLGTANQLSSLGSPTRLSTGSTNCSRGTGERPTPSTRQRSGPHRRLTPKLQAARDHRGRNWMPAFPLVLGHPSPQVARDPIALPAHAHRAGC